VAVAAFPGQALAATSATHPSSVPPHCPTTNLRVDFGKPPRPRSLDLVGDGGQMRLPVARAPQRYGTVILKPGQHASFALTYLLEAPQEIQGELGAWGPNTAVTGLPGGRPREPRSAAMTPTTLGLLKETPRE
jgi:hypothetical protein